MIDGLQILGRGRFATAPVRGASFSPFASEVRWGDGAAVEAGGDANPARGIADRIGTARVGRGARPPRRDEGIHGAGREHRQQR
jgi:hypothetical protein